MRTVGTKLVAEVGDYVRNIGKAEKANKGLKDSTEGATKATDKSAVAAKGAGKAAEDLGDKMRGTARHASALEAEIEGLQKQLVTVAAAMAAADNPDAFRGFKKELRQVKSDLRDRMDLKKILTPAGEDGASGFFFGFSQKIGPLLAKAPVSAPLLGAFAAATPLIAATITAGILAGMTGATVSAGVKLALQDPAVKAEAKEFGAFLGKELGEAAEAFRPATVGAMRLIRKEVMGLRGDLKEVFDQGAAYVAPLTRGVSEFVKGALPGIKKGIEGAAPVVAAIERGFIRMGAAVGDALGTIVGGSNSAAVALGDLFLVMEYGVTTVGGTVRAFTEAYEFLTGGLRLVIPALRGNEDASAAWTAELERLRHEIGETSEAMKLAQQQAETLKTAEEMLATEQRSLEATFETLAPRASHLTSVVDGLRRATDMMYGAAIRGAEANEAWEASWDNLSESVEQNKGAFKRNADNLSIHTAAGRANRDAVQDLIGRTNELYFAEIETGTSVAAATKKHEGRIKAIKEEAKRLGLNKTETQKLIDTYGRIPPKKTTDLVLRSIDAVADALLDLAAIQLHLAKGTPISADLRRRLARAQYGMPETKRAHGGPLPGHAPHDRADNELYWGTPGEWVIQRPTVRKVEQRHGPGAMQYFNRYGELPAYALGGRLNKAVFPKQMLYQVTAGMTKVPSLREAIDAVPFAMGSWPSSPAAQRGDSGVWRAIVAMVRAAGFGTPAVSTYRDGDPKWHGSGRAVDFGGFNLDPLARFFLQRQSSILEMIHRTGSRDYAFTRGRDMGSFNNALMESHRNHLHIALGGGGVVREPVFGIGASGRTYSFGENYRPERVTPMSANATAGVAYHDITLRWPDGSVAARLVIPGIRKEMADKHGGNVQRGLGSS